MITQLRSLFHKRDVVSYIQKVLPDLFYKAEMECTRGGKIGPEVGCLREQQLVSMLKYFLPKGNVNEDVPSMMPEVDVEISGKPLAIRTAKDINGVKASWKVDPIQVENFINTYRPKADLLFVHVQWGKNDLFEKYPSIYHVPIEAAIMVHTRLGKGYLVPPKKGTDSKGIQFSRRAIMELLNHPLTAVMSVEWIRPTYKHDPLHRWFKMWSAGHVHRKYVYYK